MDESSTQHTSADTNANSPADPTPSADRPKREDVAGGTTPTESTTPKSPKTEANTKANSSSGKRQTAESNIRVSVETLDTLMNLAGELVLARNQLLQQTTNAGVSGLDGVTARINQVTSELQDAIVQTRMQPIGNVLSKFSRVVRDLSNKLGKECQLTVTGKEVEVDKTILEAIGDPLTHLVRNAVDHGLETPDERRHADKNPVGQISLQAFHQSDKVRILIQDDGRGIDTDKVRAKAVEKGLVTVEQASQLNQRDAARLIFAPGFSTAEKLSDVSGRGVGMDVVRTNIERLGGIVEIDSKLGQGSTIEVTLPLTLAIIPSLIVSTQGDRFAIPQSSIAELVRVPRGELSGRIERIKSAEVLRLRGQLLPLVRLDRVIDDNVGGYQPPSIHPSEQPQEPLSIVVVDTGQQRYGIVVDELFDSEEIVVRPLGRHFKDCQCLSGATILGDGRIALILDSSGIAGYCGLHGYGETTRDSEQELNEELESEDDTMLLFQNHADEQFAIPTGVVARVDRIRRSEISSIGEVAVIARGAATIPLLSLHELINAKSPVETERAYMAVFSIKNREVGLLVPHLDDIRAIGGDIDMETFKELGVSGSKLIDERETRILDLFELAEKAHPDWFNEDRQLLNEEVAEESRELRILLAEDSDFFRKQVRKYLSELGFTILEACDGREAWEMLEQGAEVDLVVTDIQMPFLNGFELCERIKADPKFRSLPVIALTSLAGEEDIRRGQEAGVDEYQVKMDRERLREAVGRLVMKTGKKTPVASQQPLEILA